MASTSGAARNVFNASSDPRSTLEYLDSSPGWIVYTLPIILVPAICFRSVCILCLRRSRCSQNFYLNQCDGCCQKMYCAPGSRSEQH
eukprot:2456954-Pleurochrysis_carterae.AAC.3